MEAITLPFIRLDPGVMMMGVSSAGGFFLSGLVLFLERVDSFF